MHSVTAFFIGALVLLPVVSVAADTPTVATAVVSTLTQASIPLGASRVPVLEVTLHASCEKDLTIHSITVQHSGLGRSEDIERIYLLSNGLRASRARSFNGDQKAELRFAEKVIPACTEETFIVAGDIAQSALASSVHVFRVHALQSSEPVSIVHEEVTGSGAGVRTTYSAAGDITVRFLDLQRAIRYGSDRTIARIQLTAGKTADQAVGSILLTNNGSAKNSDLQLLRFETRDGTVVSNTATSLTDDRVLLEFNPPLIIGRGDTLYIELHADVRGSRRRTIRMQLEEESDLLSENVYRRR